IARHWGINERVLPASPAKRALGRMKNIFIFCGLCGYLFIPIKMVWPAWRLYDLFMMVLAFTTWRYAWNAKDLRVVYQELRRTHQLTQDLAESREESRRKSRFLNAISHDMKTPLNGMSLQAELALMLLEGPLAEKEEARAAVEEIRMLALSAGRLLDEFLELGRLDWIEERIRPSAFPLAELLSEVVSRTRALPESRTLDVRLEEPPALVLFADRLKIDRILQNLMQNAVKFTPRGHVLLRAIKHGPGLILEVEDTGMGIASEQRTSLFDEFYQVNNRERDRSKGFGLGLAIARRLARQLGGDLEVESSFGNGSCFRLLLPESVIQPGGQPRSSDEPHASIQRTSGADH
ncbi:MAG TPA: HAMP domain-containing sensor histidine kinase, partial [Isosphaeraceae bacterium]|nr:HAMP domain-containing sensor histidine kinase [Isosphaeraceae bacterium]